MREGYLSFPERSVSLVQATADQLNELLFSCDTIAEFRRAKATAELWTGLDNSDQSQWAIDLAKRVKVETGNNISACVLDTGANNGHILLEPLLQDNDCHTVDSDWGSFDNDGHGTLMCGIAGFGNEIDRLLQSQESVEMSHYLESVKLIPDSGSHHDEDLYGFLTKQAISRAEVERPDNRRAVCLAVTSEDHRDEGRPSSWSGSVDQLCAGTDDSVRRLIVVSGGNILDPNEWLRYPCLLYTSPSPRDRG